MLVNLIRADLNWYERLHKNKIIIFLLGLLFVAFLPSFLFNLFYNQKLFSNTFFLSFCFYAFSFSILSRFKFFPGDFSSYFYFYLILFFWLFFLFLVSVFKFEISLSVFFISLILYYVIEIITYQLELRIYKPKVALLPFGRAHLLADAKNIDTDLLSLCLVNYKYYDAVVADFLAQDLSYEWQELILNCKSAGLPVFHSEGLIEIILGRLSSESISREVTVINLSMRIYLFFKRVFDISIVLLFSPIWLFIIFILIFIIKLESRGPAFFIQERVGKNNKNFSLYKLRSMFHDSETSGAQFSQVNDERITRIGKFIRKTRLDEVPQFINVLKGDMSIIGPRPEQRVFVDQFEKEIPMYSYRHCIQPGITGWAQIMYGYTSTVAQTRIKTEYDFYYIKNISFSLDLFILFNTMRIIITGFGAR